MASIESIKNEWKADASINPLKVVEEISRSPLLHSKYLDFIVEYRAKRSSALKTLNAMKNLKRKYYRGECTQEELREHSWHQWQGLKPSGAELNSLFEQDPDLNDLEERLEYYNTGLATLEYIMKAIQGRGWELKTITEWVKFQAGG